jgi:hypothetical protein
LETTNSIDPKEKKRKKGNHVGLYYLSRKLGHFSFSTFLPIFFFFFFLHSLAIKVCQFYINHVCKELCGQITHVYKKAIYTPLPPPKKTKQSEIC